MDKKTYNIVAAVTVGIIGVAEAVVAAIDFQLQAAVAASLPVLEGAVLTIANNFVIKENEKKENKEDK
jgi:RNA-binding protein YhbY